MVFNCLSPVWFFGYDVAFELVFALVSLTLSLFAFKIFKKTTSRQAMLFGSSFLLITMSYIFQSISNFLIITNQGKSCGASATLVLFDYLGRYSYMIFMLAGLSVLIYMVLGTKNKAMLALLLTTSMLTIFISSNAFHAFYLLSTIYLTFISLHFLKNYLKNKQTMSLLVAIAFLLLLFGSVHFFISVNHQLFYAIGHITDLIAYILILINFYLVLKK